MVLAPLNVLPETARPGQGGDSPRGVPGRWQRPGTREGKVTCTLCPRYCELGDGQSGFCFVRRNYGGQIYNTTYGRSTGFAVDPVEKKPLNHFLPGTPILSFGTAGCNLGCKFCQNWTISKSQEVSDLSVEASPRAVVEMALRRHCPSIAFTYNDPVIWAEYAIDTSIEAHKAGLRAVQVTAGYVSPEAREEVYRHTDAANVDLKGFTEQFYHKLAFGHLKPVLDTLSWLKRATKVWFEITTLLIPGHNDSEAEVRELSRWVFNELGPDVPLHFTAFHPDFKLRDVPRTPHETLTRSRAIARDAGLHFVYVGNVHDRAGQTTYCPKCGVELIQRDWHEVEVLNLVNGACARCKTPIPGVWA